MLLTEFFEYLTYGDLSHLSVSSLGENGITIDDQPKFINPINLGLVALYTRLPLRTAEVHIQLYDHIDTYFLDSNFAQSNTASTASPKYIVDSLSQPFTDSVLKVDNVFNEIGDEFPMNDSEQEASVYTPDYNSIQVPFAASENAITAVYRSGPDRLTTRGQDPDTVNVPIPYYLLDALLGYVAMKIYSGMGNDKKAGIFRTIYEEQILIVDQRGLTHDETVLNEKLWRNQWV